MRHQHLLLLLSLACFGCSMLPLWLVLRPTLRHLLQRHFLRQLRFRLAMFWLTRRLRSSHRREAGEIRSALTDGIALGPWR